MASKEVRRNFYNQIGAIAVKVCKERGYGNAQVWTCMAQAACESNYGQSNIMRNAHAYFGIKATKSWVQKAKYGGLVYSAKTKECYDGKTYVNISDTFRAYRNMEDSIRDYFDLIEGQRYKDSLNKSTVKDCITVIKNGGYATAPTYISTICSFYNTDKDIIEKWTVSGAAPVVNVKPTSTYKVGLTYTLCANLYVRTSPNGEKKPFSEFTKDGKLHGYDDGTGGLLRKGTKITCQGISIVNKQTWLKCPSGYVCAIGSKGDVYIK